ncbi:MAG: L-threonylcarbamoyladenylate synthase [Verrucomicrobia bacterium]|nr:L-threonylcarbamoyladenylate synthase [Verrucomicrobiota bacterium]
MKTRILQAPDGVSTMVEALAAGEPVAMPTETVYGLAADALSPNACAKIFEAKNRPLSDPLIVHIPSIDWLPRLTSPTPAALQLAEKFWPGPLTMVLPRQPIVPDIVTAGQETVAIRMSAHPLFQEVATAFGKPLAAPSANRFGRISPTSAAHVLAELDGRIPFILDGGPCAHGIESTIVHVSDDGLRILREGPITREDLRAFAPLLDDSIAVSAPGGLKSHYAPRTPLVLEKNPAPRSQKTGLLAFSAPREGFAQTEILSATSDLREAAANLYGAMRRLDEAGLDLIVAEEIPESGIGAAIMERLRKAAAR